MNVSSIITEAATEKSSMKIAILQKYCYYFAWLDRNHFFFLSRSFQAMLMKPLDYSWNLCEKGFTGFFNYDHITLPVTTKNVPPKTFISKNLFHNFCLNLPFCYLYIRLHESGKEIIQKVFWEQLCMIVWVLWNI